MKKISVLMSVYNTSDYNKLAKAIKSILNQTYKDFEFIIIDDGSNDKTYEYLLAFAKEDSRIIVIKNDSNMTLAPSLNRCLKLAKYEYVARMDADDISLPNRLEKQLEFLENNLDVALVGSNIKIINNNDIYVRTRNYPYQVTNKDFMINCPICHPTIMIRKQILEELNGYRVEKKYIRAEDYELFLRMALHGYKMFNMPEILFLYRQDTYNCKQRKYKYCINEFLLRREYIQKLNGSKVKKYYIYKPLLVGLLPNKIYQKLKVLQFKIHN